MNASATRSSSASRAARAYIIHCSITRLRSPWGTTALKRWRTDAENVYDAQSVAAVMGSILVMRHTQSLGGSL